MPLVQYDFSELYGWVEDRFGVSWQISPTILNDMMDDKDSEAIERDTKAFLEMKKFNLDELKKAYLGDKE
ncbi:MAG: VOC family protein [Clostridia bacterium]|nr:VOC family protein [Clostridia bacterium]